MQLFGAKIENSETILFALPSRSSNDRAPVHHHLLHIEETEAKGDSDQREGSRLTLSECELIKIKLNFFDIGFSIGFFS
jgi:hypothetical protein